ncbi:MAG: hypothetical protein IKO11_03165, partial [Lachnospiraceae bacterium]|nr:hypothetical protein [Lachnospiraceae bacterium]
LLDGVPGDMVYNGKTYKTPESCVLARKVAKATQEELKTPEMIAAVAQDFAENFTKELPEHIDAEHEYDRNVLRGNSIGSLDTLNKVIKAIVPPDVFVNVIRQIEKEEGGAGTMHNMARYYVYAKQQATGATLDKPIEPMTPEEIETARRQVNRVFSTLGEKIQTDQLGQLLSGALKAYTDRGMSAEEASMWLMNNAMLRCGALDTTIFETMKQRGVTLNTGWDENMTPEQKEGFDIINAMRMMQDEANALLKLKPEERDRNPFLTAASRRLTSTAAAQQPAN